MFRHASPVGFVHHIQHTKGPAHGDEGAHCTKGVLRMDAVVGVGNGQVISNAHTCMYVLLKGISLALENKPIP